MLPNLDRIPATGDPRAKRTLANAPLIADRTFLDSIGADGALNLARYGIRRTTVALRRGSVEVLTDALWASALGAAVHTTEGRDFLVGLALPHVVAREVGVDPATLFASIADRVPGSPVAQTMVEFGARRDVDLASFGWTRVETPDGPDFIPN